jgi:hypothetical protein
MSREVGQSSDWWRGASSRVSDVVVRDSRRANVCGIYVTLHFAGSSTALIDRFSNTDPLRQRPAPASMLRGRRMRLFRRSRQWRQHASGYRAKAWSRLRRVGPATDPAVCDRCSATKAVAVQSVYGRDAATADRRRDAVAPRPLDDGRVGLDAMSDFQHSHGAAAISREQASR